MLAHATSLFTKAGNGELSSIEFLSLLGYSTPIETMRDYLAHFLTLDQDFFDNNVENLKVAQETGTNTILFNRDNEVFSGNIVNNFQELNCFLEDFDV